MNSRVTIFLIAGACEVFKIGSFADGGNATTFTGSQEPCASLPERHVRAYYGFPSPLQYSFPQKRTLVKLSKSNETVGLNASCTVIDEGLGVVVARSNFLPSSSYVYSKLKIAYLIPEAILPKNFSIRCGFPVNSSSAAQNISSCVLEKVKLVLQNVTSNNCTDESIKELSKKRLIKGSIHKLKCRLPQALKYSKVKIEWFKYENNQCKSDFNKSPVVLKSSELQFSSTDFDDAGLYTCMATFNGRKMLIAKYSVCVRYPSARNSDMELKCTNQTTTIGRNVNISCTINLSARKFYDGLGYVYWYKISSGATIEVCNDTVTDSGKKFGCSVITTIPENQCYLSEPPEAPTEDTRTITLTIKNIEESDLGSYQLIYYPTQSLSLVGNMTIAKDVTQKRLEQIYWVTVAVVLCSFSLVLLLLVIVWKIDVLWLLKKYFGKSVTGDRITARFLYTYDMERQNDKSMRNTKTLVESVEVIVKKIGGTVSDVYRDVPKHQFDTENVTTMYDDCLRIIIFLSPDFVKDHWSRYETYTAFGDAIRKGKKVILLTMPGTKDAIKRIKDDSRKTLQTLMKRNITICWNGKVPLSRKFNRQLEYALPKLKKLHNHFVDNQTGVQSV